MSTFLKNVLIITPSLNLQDNVSGISSFSRTLIDANKEYNYIPFYVGKKDHESRNLKWFVILLFRPLLLLFFKPRKIDFVHFNLGLEPKSIIRDIILFLVLKIRMLPIIIHIHGGRYLNKKIPLFYRILINFYLKFSRCLIVLSNLEKQKLLKEFPYLKSDKIYVIPNAVKVPLLSECKKNYKSKDIITLLYLGRLDKAKGLEKIIQASYLLFKKHINFRLLICGCGPDLVWLKSIIPNEIKDVIFIEGLVSGRKKIEVLCSSHFFLLPSDFEGLPFALLEAMAYSVIPLVTPVGSIPNVVKNNFNGKIVFSAVDICSGIVELLQNPNIEKFAFRARQTIIDNYSISIQINKVIEVYKKNCC